MDRLWLEPSLWPQWRLPCVQLLYATAATKGIRGSSYQRPAVDRCITDGKWMLDDPRYKDKGSANDIAGTAFGLLPLLGAGTQGSQAHDKPIEKLMFLMRKQDKRTGNFGGGMCTPTAWPLLPCARLRVEPGPATMMPAQPAVQSIVQAT